MRLFKAKRSNGFTLLEVLIAMAILSVVLVSIYQSFSSSVFVLSSTKNLWKAMNYAHNELTRQERGNPQVSFARGTFRDDEPMYGFEWERVITDEEPFPGVIVRKVSLTLTWYEGEKDYNYNAEIYVKPR